MKIIGGFAHMIYWIVVTIFYIIASIIGLGIKFLLLIWPIALVLYLLGGNKEDRIHKSKYDKKIFGVCGGIGEYFHINPLWIRLPLLLLVILKGCGVMAYLVAAIIMPEGE